MRDRRPERPGCSGLGVGVDPLRVVRRVGELVDPLLRDDAPLGEEVLPDQILDHHLITDAAQV